MSLESLVFSNELRAKLARVKPSTIGEARRIDGMTPSALLLLLAASHSTSKSMSKSMHDAF